MNVKTFYVSGLSVKNQCYLIHLNNTGIFIDPAWNYDLLNGFLEENNIKLKAILLTHSHIDHINLANEFAQKYNVPVYMSKEEIDYYNFSCTNLIEVKHLQDIILNGFRIQPILTPGHTKGSVCYLIENHLFSGDTVFIEGVGICSVEGSDVHQMYDSVQYLKKSLPLDTFIWPGHSYGELPGKTLRFLLKNNIYFQLENRKHFTSFRMRKGQKNLFDFM
ncbi:MBL fold metallo-hydrolase [uncultured Aquimarina sp.]|uniref:MBL fold metallo-hydrolase n=1 Tax=uncultured Aquimarina sp. TaxID=575652 RepID=UPI00263390F5|nr:MBL fold metallo-hydrolase [uncultured Aquimarina sp.]